MTLILMNTDKKVTEDGFIIRQLKKGLVYDLRENTARTLFASESGIKPTEREANRGIISFHLDSYPDSDFRVETEQEEKERRWADIKNNAIRQRGGLC